MRKQTAWTLVLLALLAVFPGRARARPGLLYSFVRRVLIYALAATSLNLILGYGGMVALGHAASSAPAPMRWASWPCRA